MVYDIEKEQTIYARGYLKAHPEARIRAKKADPVRFPAGGYARGDSRRDKQIEEGARVQGLESNLVGLLIFKYARLWTE